MHSRGKKIDNCTCKNENFFPSSILPFSFLNMLSFQFFLAAGLFTNQITASPITIRDLPTETLANIGKFLPPPDAVRLGNSNKRMNGALDMILEESIGNVADPTNFNPWNDAKQYEWGVKHMNGLKKFLARQNSSEANAAFQVASENGHLEVVRLLLNHRDVNPEDENNYAIRWASENGHLKVVRLLLHDSRVNPADDGNYAIKWASGNGHLEVVQLLLNDSRVNPADRDNYAIRLASKKGHSEIA